MWKWFLVLSRFRTGNAYTPRVASITLMTGENLYALRLEKKRWIDEFVKKYGADTVVRMEGKGLTVRDLLDEVGVMPFLAEKRLVIVDGVPKATKEEMTALEAAVHPSTILLFADPAPDKRLGGVKQLMEIAATKTFPAVRGPKLMQWLSAEAAGLGVTFERGAAESMVERLGDDQEALASELEKLAVGIQGRAVTLDDIDVHTIPTDEGVVWTMTDLISAGKKKEALAYARRLLERGSDAYGLWAILLSMLKNVVAVRAALDDGLAGKDIAERTGVHPFALRSVQPYAAKCTREELARAVAWTVEADVRLKTGGYRATDDAPQELHTLIERFFFAMPGGR